MTKRGADMTILLNEDEIIAEIHANKKQLPSIDELHFEIWDLSRNRKGLTLSMIYRNPADNRLKMSDYLTLHIAECDTEHEKPVELQTYVRLLKTHLKRKFPDKKVSSNLHL